MYETYGLEKACAVTEMSSRILILVFVVAMDFSTLSSNCDKYSSNFIVTIAMEDNYYITNLLNKHVVKLGFYFELNFMYQPNAPIHIACMHACIKP